MGCFLGCFGGPKDRRRGRAVKRIPSRERVPVHYELLQQNSLRKLRQQQQGSSPLKLQLLPAEEVRPGSLPESRDTNEQWVAPLKQLPEEKPPTPVLELREKVVKPSSSIPRKKVTFDLNVKTYEQEPAQDDQTSCSVDAIEEQEHSNDQNSQKEGSSTPQSSEAFPSNHRYQNCTINDGENSEEDGEDDYSDEYEEEEDDYEDCALGDDEDALIRGTNDLEEAFESYFSLAMEREKQDYEEASHAVRDRSRYVHSVLNPVENLSQWKQAKAKAQPTSLKLLKKENIDVVQEPELPFSSHPSFELPRSHKALDSTPNLNIHTKDEVLIEASLSNWLPSSKTSPAKGFKGNICCRTESKVSLDDRTIVGAVSN